MDGSYLHLKEVWLKINDYKRSFYVYISEDTRLGLSDEKSFAIGFYFAVECAFLIAAKAIKQKRQGIIASKNKKCFTERRVDS